MRQLPFGSLAAVLIAGHVCIADAAETTSTNTAKPTAAKSCKPSKTALGVSRTITIDTKSGPKYGYVNYKGNEILKDKEVLLTFDDGPLPKYTNKVLKALEKECTRATFFAVGRMSIAFPKTVRRILREGHTLGTHTWSHGNLGRSGSKRAIAQIERGIAAIEAAAGTKISPVFRFPYLARTNAMETHLASRNISVFSIDVDSRDTRGYSSKRIVSSTIAALKRRGKGIVLFHDIKPASANAMPEFLRQLRKNGFKIVHLKTSSYSAPLASYKKRYDDLIAARASGNRKKIKLAQRALKELPSRNVRKKRVGSIKENSAIVPSKFGSAANAHDRAQQR